MYRPEAAVSRAVFAFLMTYIHTYIHSSLWRFFSPTIVQYNTLCLQEPVLYCVLCALWGQKALPVVAPRSPRARIAMFTTPKI